MGQTYSFQISMPVGDTLPRNRFVNRIHLEHVAGGLTDTDLGTMCDDILQLYQVRYGHADKEIDVRAYDVGPTPNYPRHTSVVNAGQAWTITQPREIALCLSYSAANRGNKNERGRIYLAPQLNPAHSVNSVRPSPGALAWALEWYTKPNESFPDLGGVDWKFGVWSPTRADFTQTTQAWVNDDWDVQRRRGLRESTRVAAQREG